MRSGIGQFGSVFTPAGAYINWSSSLGLAALYPARADFGDAVDAVTGASLKNQLGQMVTP
jgi:hypothetical protein